MVDTSIRDIVRSGSAMLESDQQETASKIDRTMRVRQLIRPDIMVSAIAHLSVLALIFLFAEVRQFNEVTTAPIAVDLVTPEEIKNQPQPEPAPTPPLPSQPLPSPETTEPPPQ